MKYLYFFEDCKIINGIKNNVLYDLSRNEILKVPEQVIKLYEFNKFPLIKIPEDFISVIDYVVKKEYAIILDEQVLELFSPIEIKDENHELLESVIIFSHLQKQHEWLIKLLPQIGCDTCLLRCDLSSDVEIKEYISKFIKYGFTRIDVIFSEKKYFSPVLNNVNGIGTIIIYNQKNDFNEQLLSGKTILHRKESLISSVLSHNNSKVSTNYFMVNLKNFIKNHYENSYFSNKLYIDFNYNLKNSIEDSEIFENINNLNSSKFKSIICSKKFNRYKFITKDNFIDCSVCEFRYCCNDNRLPFQREDGSWYHKTECNYNPYICKWEGEEGYQTLEECGVISNEKGFSIDHERIAAINKILWEEETESAK